jgi:ATP-dependent helicase YprA (DUF1998 family)
MINAVQIENRYAEFAQEYVIEKYNELDDKFLNTENEEDKFEQFMTEIFNTDDSFYERIKNEIFEVDLLVLLNYSNTYFEENFDIERTLRTNLTRERIIGAFGCAYYMGMHEELLDYLKENLDIDEDSDEDSDNDTVVDEVLQQ